MQMQWTKTAEQKRICQLTHPRQVLRFIRESPGLTETCREYPHFLAIYAPQLTIPGLGGEFEGDFDKVLEWYRSEHGGRCPEYLLLRDPRWSEFEPASVACQFVQGDCPGPPCRTFPIFDYAMWFLSKRSSWLPPEVHALLLRGLKDWAMWPWATITEREAEHPLRRWSGMGALAESLYGGACNRSNDLGAKELADLAGRVALSRRLLRLPEPADVLTHRFLEAGFVEAHAQSELARRARREGSTQRRRARRDPNVEL